MAIKFFDTCSLLSNQRKIFEEEERFYISSITINELESIKTAGYKSEDVKYQARKLLHLLNEHQDKYDIILYRSSDDEALKEYNLPQTNDSRIIVAAKILSAYQKDLVFVTQDLACKAIAKSVGLQIEYIDPDKQFNDEYKGFKEISMNENELATFYNSELYSNENKYNLLENEYLIIKSTANNEIVDQYKYKDGQYIKIKFQSVESKMFGKIKPKDQDIYQQLALESLNSNKITMLKGPAGSGKSYLSFGTMFDWLEHGKIAKIIVFCNTVATKGSAKLGYYPGSRTEKLLDSQIGNLLESKLGDRGEVERLIEDGSLVLLPMSDIRGYDTTGMNAAIYISEAQNLDIELMRLALQRIGEDSYCILDGDCNTQVDSALYAGDNNGMRRVSEVFRGNNFYGEVELQNIHRSQIAKLAQLL